MIVQSLPPLPSGGAEIQALRIAEILIAKGVKVTFITPGVGKIKGVSEINGIPVYRLHGVLNLFLDILFQIQKQTPKGSTIIEYDDHTGKHSTISRKIGWGARLRYLIFLINASLFLKKRKDEFDILHSHTIEWPAYVACKLGKWYNMKLLVKDSTMNGIFNILRYPNGERKQKALIDQADFVAMTRVIENNLSDAGVPQNKIHRISNGIKITDTYIKDYSSNRKVLFVGNLYQQPAKGIDILLKAWKIVAGTQPQAVLEIAGDGDLKAYNNYLKKIGIEQSVHFLGKCNNIEELMLSSDVFVLPSRREGMPNVLMEAMLKALPCIATDISGSQDLIKHGVSGLLAPAASVNDLAENIVYMLTHRQEAMKMGRQARQTIIESYNLDYIADKYISLYNNL